jgi:exodeoxyribonuclease VII small subunit
MSKKNTNFEESLKRLQEISEMLENEEVSLDDSVKIYEEGIRLSKQCYTLLENAELKVKELNKDLQKEMKQ